jgi:hypothetical protein
MNIFQYLFIIQLFITTRGLKYTKLFGEEFWQDVAYDFPCRVYCPFDDGFVCWKIPENDYGTLCTPGSEYNPNSPNLWRTLCPKAEFLRTTSELPKTDLPRTTSELPRTELPRTTPERRQPLKCIFYF